MTNRRWGVALTCALVGCGSDNFGATTKATTESAGVNTDATGTSGETDATTVPTGGAEMTATQPTGGEQPTVTCAPLPAGVVGVEYKAEVSIDGSVPPYEWTISGLPSGLKLVTDDASPASATITGIPTNVGTSAVSLVVEAEGVEVYADCGDLVIDSPPALDPARLLENFPQGCIGPGVTISDLQQAGVITGAAGSPATCSLVPGRGNGSGDFDEDPNTPSDFPPGIKVDPDTCELTGQLNVGLPFGTYAWITYLKLGDTLLFLPYCAAQPVEFPAAYAIAREDSGVEATLTPGLTQLASDNAGVSYGSTSDPKVIITDDDGACPMGATCYYSFYWTYDTVSSQSGIVALNPSEKFPAVGFDGFTHVMRISDEPLDIFKGRAFVVGVDAHYCIADNPEDCGNEAFDADERAQLIRKNGGGSRYRFSLIVLPAG